MSAVHSQEPSKIAVLAADCIKRADGNAQQATTYLIAEVSKSNALFRELMSPLLKTAAAELIGSQIRQTRNLTWDRKEAAERGKSLALALVHGTVRSLLDFPLPGGKRLGDATAEEIATAAEFYRKQAEDMADKAAWLRLIAARVPANMVARQALTDADLQSMQKDARNAS